MCALQVGVVAPGYLVVIFIIHRAETLCKFIFLIIRFLELLRHHPILVWARSIHCYRCCARIHDPSGISSYFVTKFNYILSFRTPIHMISCYNASPVPPSCLLSSSRRRAHATDDRGNRVGSQGPRHCGHLLDPR